MRVVREVYDVRFQRFRMLSVYTNYLPVVTDTEQDVPAVPVEHGTDRLKQVCGKGVLRLFVFYPHAFAHR